LGTVLARRERSVLLVASRYPNQDAPLWHLPGGRPREGESLAAAAIRELAEETSLQGTISSLAFASESFDRKGHVHVLSLTFEASVNGALAVPTHDAHVVDAAWVPEDELAARMHVAVVREPILAYLRGDRRRYYEFTEAGISIEFADEP
jgi:ADP-ribose pyrophosphatase YjhB (NUDIX family)